MKLPRAVLVGAVLLAQVACSLGSHCHAYHATSCDTCVTAGCLWCPGNAWCYKDEIVSTACPKVDDWKATCDPNNNFFSDPLYSAQKWAYDILNVRKVWEQGFTGKGIVIQIVDDAVAVDHPEFVDRFDKEGSCDNYKPKSPENSHGTACASIALATADNDQCAAGIAPKATLTACNFNDITQAYKKAIEAADISSNSWNFDACTEIYGDDDAVTGGQRRWLEEACPLTDEKMGGKQLKLKSKKCGRLISEKCTAEFEKEVEFCEKYLSYYVECKYNELTPREEKELRDGVEKGRGGKGVIFVFAAGNEYGIGETINMEGYLNSRYTISVGAVDQGMVHSSYSSSGGSALFMTGPGGDHEYNTNHVSALIGGGCKDAGVGTSFATPAVSGAIALVLEANPKLGWRDVQGILALTAQKVEPNSPSWIKNAAGFSHSTFYGFGVMDAFAAVEMAKTWKIWGKEIKLERDSGEINQTIGDDPHKPGKDITRLPDWGIVAESVVVSLHVEHASRGNLQVLLKSPLGTVSELVPSKRRETQTGDDSWQLMSLLFWGENPTGNWQLKLVDDVPGNLVANPDAVLGSLACWNITVYGHKILSDDV